MNRALLQEADDRNCVGQRGTAPHLSYSRINRYLLCPEQYRLYYVENLRPVVPAASLLFGQIMHQALAVFFSECSDAIGFFQEAWDEAREMELRYVHQETWKKLEERGRKLLHKFLTEELWRIGEVRASEKVFELSITNLDLPLIGVVDLVAEFDKKLTVIDFKTSSSSPQDYEAHLSDQLTAYQLAEPEAEQSALCMFMKTKESKIDWHVSQRSGDQLNEFLRKAEIIGRGIAERLFYRRSGKWCSWCDYLAVCLGDEQRVRETLAQAA